MSATTMMTTTTLSSVVDKDVIFAGAGGRFSVVARGRPNILCVFIARCMSLKGSKPLFIQTETVDPHPFMRPVAKARHG